MERETIWLLHIKEQERMIYIRTFAYNAEKTLERTIESLLKQTYGDFVYYLLDNGSTDSTGEIVRRYADKDSRIRPFFSKKNFDKTINSEFWLLSQNLNDDDYMCFLDADDVYESTFLEEILEFMIRNDLDIAACGTNFIDADSGEVCEGRVLRQNLVLDKREMFDYLFPEVHWNLRQVWGKLYSANAVRARFDVNKPEWYPDAYGGDTVNVYECVKAADRIGVYAKALHLYSISRGSVSYRWIDGRERADFILFERAIDLLMQKCGYVSARNLNFLYAVQFNALRDTLNVLFNSSLSEERKIDIVREIFLNPITQQSFIERGHITEESKAELLAGVVCQSIELVQNVSDENLKAVEEIFRVLNGDFSQMIPIEYLRWYINNMPVIVRNIALREYEYATNNLLGSLVEKKELILESEHPFVLGQMVSALVNKEDCYVFFSKKLIAWYINNGKIEQACEELEEWRKIMPDDEEFINMSNAIKR